MCSLGMSMSLGLSQKLTLRQSISHTVITPTAECPKCDYNLSNEEIQTGWTNDPSDFTTKCPKCNECFIASLRLKDDDGDITYCQYLCKDQLFAELRKVQRGKSKRLGIKFLLKKHTDLLWNMVKHFGTYDNGLEVFKSI